MISTSQSKRKPLPSVLTIYRPIEQFWALPRPAGSPASEPPHSLDPFDAFLVHRVLELIPMPPLLVDTAIAQTGGGSCLIGLDHPRVRGVWAVTVPQSLACERAVGALRDYIRSRRCELAPLDVVARSELPDELGNQPGIVILADARAGNTGALAEEISRWLHLQPDALVLTLGLGPVGDCPAIRSLLSRCTPGSGLRLQLMRELAEVLMASRLGLVARHDHPHVADTLLRLRQMYTGNYTFLELIRELNHAALRQSGIDSEVMKTHHTFGMVWAELDELKQTARQAKEQATAASQALQEARERLAVVPPALPWVLVRTRQLLARTPVGSAYRMAKRARRKLAPTPGGRAHRMATWLRNRLAPTPVGRAYRLARKVARACVPAGRSGLH
jgi:hypothetical protein